MFRRKKKEPTFVTVTFADECLDYPKNAPIPRKGELVFFKNNHGRVTDVLYHVSGFENEIFMINIRADKSLV